ncbi:2-C-methyl-D-erythritol 4-phosphate cytidylyltransferase [Aliikangiella sp. IMCC44359]|uniref:2-C-methyl-D-erythritol 4-phosphate cytidylyltransferase n=1 Tax=Aliikangiella sp. IMCC44359 TaxID=3459125 RepID=UPI00403AF102
MPGDLSNFSGTVAIIPAAGSGSRMGTDVPKQYLTINQATILDITLEKFLSYAPVKLIILVISPDDNRYTQLKEIDNKKIVVIDGGEERVHSVYNALRYLYDHGLPDHTAVMVHDAARPCISHHDLDKLNQSFLSNSDACLLTAPITDTIQQLDEKLTVQKAVDRSLLVRALTPQMAQFIELKQALRSAIDSKALITDEASALVASGYQVNAVTGRSDNIKITHPDDLTFAEFYLSRENA